MAQDRWLPQAHPIFSFQVQAASSAAANSASRGTRRRTNGEACEIEIPKPKTLNPKQQDAS